jgi:FAD/FMN-containing dehydrogenase
VAGDLAGLSGRLAEIVGAAQVTQAPRDLAAVGIPVDRQAGPPAWLARPGSAAEIAHVVRLADEAGAVLVPVGTATRRPRTAGDRPRIVLDLKRLSHVVGLDETSLTVHAQAGITGLALEQLLLPRGLTLGDFPPAVLRSTLGGMLAVRTPGKS